MRPSVEALLRAKIRLNADSYDEAVTDSMENIQPSPECPHLPGAEELVAFMKARRKRYPALTSQEIFRKALGAPRCVVEYSLPNEVWTFSREGTRIWALLSEEGVAWEWDARGHPREAIQIRKEVEKALLL